MVQKKLGRNNCSARCSVPVFSRSVSLCSGLILFFPIAALFAAMACTKAAPPPPGERPPPAADRWAPERESMVETQIAARGVSAPLVLDAMRAVPRHLFVPEQNRALAHADHPLPIGERQTISQPYIVALMTELLGLEEGDKVLEIGTGSGYQAAVLAEVVGSRSRAEVVGSRSRPGAADREGQVFTIEIVESLAERSKKLLADLGYNNITVRHGDGYQGWPEEAPFDAVIVTAAPEHVPQPLLDQLGPGGRLVIPVGVRYQNLILFTRTSEGFRKKSIAPVLFVPMTGEARRREEKEGLNR